MKKTLFIASLAAYLMGAASGATYTELTSAWSDEANHVIYNGKGYFAVESGSSTSVDLTIDLDSLLSYVNSNDYKSGNYMLLWDTQYDYGLADNADTTQDNGSRSPYLSGYWDKAAWNADTNNISYQTLSKYASNGSVVLNITNSSSTGVRVTTLDSSGTTHELYKADTLKAASNTSTSGYYINLNYVTGVTLNTISTLDTSTYVPPPDYSEPFISTRSDGSSVGRVTFLGDSITHGVNDQSYRWQLFKTMVDNGIEFEIAGPRDGYYNTPNHTRDAGSSYGGEGFANVHLAQASGRTHNIISGSTSASVNGTNYSSGVNYSGHSTASTAANFDSNTWFCMMGTNDLISDTPNSGPTTDQYATQMQKMLGGTVQYDAATDRYTWTAGSNWGSMSTIVNDVCQEGDTFYMLSITPWGNHSNHNRDMDHYAGAEFNRNLQAWVQAYASTSGKNIIYVDVTRGMTDPTADKRSMGHNSFFNNNSDRLHPNEQGSLIMAGNLARAMGIGGRTAGLARQAADGWSEASEGRIAAGATIVQAENAFTMNGGYTIDLATDFGDGEANGWLGAEHALSISLGDGVNSGTLNISEGHIMWGSDVLFCWDNSTLSDEGNLRIAWHNGNTADNVLAGYYVWLDDMLIGQGLSATTGEGLNGIRLSASGAAGSIQSLSWVNQAYAPTTSGTFSAAHAYLTTQSAASISLSSGVDFSSSESTTTAGNQVLVTTASGNDTITRKLGDGGGWTGMTNCNHSGDINLQVTGATTYTVFGSMNNGTAGALTLEVAEGASIGNGSYSGQTAAIAGSYGNGNAERMNVYVQGGTVNGDIVGGAVHGSGRIGSVQMVINGGTITGSLHGGSKSAGSVGNASIIITGGTIEGGIVAGGNAGTIGNSSITISGGTIKGNITKGNATRSEGASTAVTIVGDQADIRGSIEADQLTLSNVRKDVVATIAGVSTLLVTDNTSTSAIMGDSARLQQLKLSANTSFSAYKGNTSLLNTSEHESTLLVTTLSAGRNATLNANLAFTTGATLNLEGTLTMGSDLSLTSGMVLNLSEEMQGMLNQNSSVILFSGVDALTLDGQTIRQGSQLDAGGIFTNLGSSSQYHLSYGADGSVSLTIPEPATATLGLAALCMLMLRRRK